MENEYGRFLRTRREILGLTQRELAQRAGVQQPVIAAIERGRRGASESARSALDRAVAIRPSVALAARRADIRRLFSEASLPEPHVFGSVARGEDTESSDLDLLVEFDDSHDIADLLDREERLERLLSVHADVVDARGAGPGVAAATAEAVPL